LDGNFQGIHSRLSSHSVANRRNLKLIDARLLDVKHEIGCPAISRTSLHYLGILDTFPVDRDLKAGMTLPGAFGNEKWIVSPTFARLPIEGPPTVVKRVTWSRGTGAKHKARKVLTSKY
jgi:hypothetical protein